MKKLKNLSVLAMTFVLFFASFSSLASAEQIDENKEVIELAKTLEFIFEEAAIKDELGNVIDLHIDMIEEEFGTSPELDLLIEQRDAFINQSKQIQSNRLVAYAAADRGGDAVDRCIDEKVRTGFADLVSGAFIGAVIDDIFSKNYLSAAQRLIKMGVRGTPIGIAGSLSGMLFSCLWTHGDNPWN